MTKTFKDRSSDIYAKLLAGRDELAKTPDAVVSIKLGRDDKIAVMKLDKSGTVCVILDDREVI